jgi:Ca-activated chloride channel family protein
MRCPTPLRFRASLVLLLAVEGAMAQRTVEKPIFRTSAEMVLVSVTVTDHDGKIVDGLRADDFKVFDDQRPQKITSFSIEDAPCSVAVVLDISGSMQPKLSQTKDIAQAFFEAANPDDEFLLLTVSTQPAATAGFTTETEALEDSIGFAQPGGLTALIDTVYLGLSRMREAQRARRALVIISDGKDNHSRYSESELMRVALEADVQIYTIVLDTGWDGLSTRSAPYRPSLIAKPWDRPAEQQGPEMLEKLSDRTGGLHFRVSGNADAREAVTKVGRALRDEYVIGYHPADSDKSGKWHRIRVKLHASGTHVHTRKGYYSQ